jgi:hypothetical protein
MRPIRVVCTMLAGLFVLGSLSFGSELVEGSDPRAEPFKKALAALVKKIDAGDLDGAKALYAGEASDADLLKVYVDGVAAAKAMRAALVAKFGDDPSQSPAGLDVDVARMGVFDFNTVIFLDDPDRASSSADSPLGVGIEFKQVDGAWKVLSLASKPDTPEQHLARLKTYISAVTAITEKVNSGKYNDLGQAAGAANDAHDQLWPIAKGPAPTTSPGQ